jgi:hypothetical protein
MPKAVLSETSRPEMVYGASAHVANGARAAQGCMTLVRRNRMRRFAFMGWVRDGYARPTLEPD